MTMPPTMGSSTVASSSTTLQWDAQARIALVRYTAGAILASSDGAFLVDALTRWMGHDGAPFAVLAYATGLGGTNAQYRARVGQFFRQHRDRACIAIIDAGAVIFVVVELFRVGTGIQLKVFADETAARAWLRTRGIAA